MGLADRSCASAAGAVRVPAVAENYSGPSDQDHRLDLGRRHHRRRGARARQLHQAKTGQTVVIDNRTGAGGNIAMDAVAKSAPDGYTLGVANTGNIVINPYLYRSMPFDPLKDLVPVGAMGDVPLFMVVNGQLPVKTSRNSSPMPRPIRSATARPAPAPPRISPRTRSTATPGEHGACAVSAAPTAADQAVIGGASR